jgi:hypothetical protein
MTAPGEAAERYGKVFHRWCLTGRAPWNLHTGDFVPGVPYVKPNAVIRVWLKRIQRGFNQ